PRGARRSDAARPRVVRGALARSASGAVVGRAGRARCSRTGARPRLVVVRRRRGDPARGAPRIVSDRGEPGPSAETVSDHLDDFVAAGLYDPEDENATARLELLDFLVEDVGASIPELVRADELGGLLSFAAFRTLSRGRDRYTLAEAAAEA